MNTGAPGGMWLGFQVLRLQGPISGPCCPNPDPQLTPLPSQTSAPETSPQGLCQQHHCSYTPYSGFVTWPRAGPCSFTCPVGLAMLLLFTLEAWRGAACRTMRAVSGTEQELNASSCQPVDLESLPSARHPCRTAGDKQGTYALSGSIIRLGAARCRTGSPASFRAQRAITKSQGRQGVETGEAWALMSVGGGPPSARYSQMIPCAPQLPTLQHGV